MGGRAPAVRWLPRRRTSMTNRTTTMATTITATPTGRRRTSMPARASGIGMAGRAGRAGTAAATGQVGLVAGPDGRAGTPPVVGGQNRTGFAGPPANWQRPGTGIGVGGGARVGGSGFSGGAPAAAAAAAPAGGGGGAQPGFAGSIVRGARRLALWRPANAGFFGRGRTENRCHCLASLRFRRRTRA